MYPSETSLDFIVDPPDLAPISPASLHIGTPEFPRNYTWLILDYINLFYAEQKDYPPPLSPLFRLHM
jgi:hypothetical protein